MLEESILELDVLAADLLSHMGTALEAAGFTRTQIITLQKGAENQLRQANLVQTEEVGILLAHSLKGTLLAVANFSSDQSKKELAISTLAASCTVFLKGRATLNSSEGSIKSRLQKFVGRFFSSEFDMLSPGNSYQEILRSIGALSINFLDDAGIAQANINRAITEVSKAITSNLTNAGVSSDQINALSKTAMIGVIGALDEAGVSAAGLDAAFDAAITGSIVGLEQSGLDSTALISAAGEITEGVIVGFGGLNIADSALESKITIIRSSIDDSLEQAGLEPTAIASAGEQLLDAAWDGMSELLEDERPVVTDKTITFDEDIATVLNIEGTDAENATLSYTIENPPAHGTLTGTAPDLTYTPDANYFGSDSFSYRADDGRLDSTQATYSLTITPVNDPPVGTPQSLSTSEDVALPITIAGTDVENDTLIDYQVAVAPAHGTISGTVPNLTYTPDADYNGPDSFSFTASDGADWGDPSSDAGIISLTVTAVNDDPEAVVQAIDATEDTVLSITLTGTDVDQDITQLTYTIVTSPDNGTLSASSGTLSGPLTGPYTDSLTYTPDLNWNGEDSFSFRVNDGTADSSTVVVTVTVAAVNDAPVGTSQSLTTSEDVALPITIAGTDVENDTLINYLVTVEPAHGTLSGTAPNLTYTPDADYNGPDSFSFTAFDGLDWGDQASDAGVISLTVTAVNDNPVADTQSVDVTEDTTLLITLTGTDVDQDITQLTYTIGTLPVNGTLSGSSGTLTGPITGPYTGPLTYTPGAEYYGTDSFTFYVADGTADSTPAVINITVASVNDQPVADSSSDIVLTEDTNVDVVLTGSDVDLDSLTYAIVSQPGNGTLTGTLPGPMTYTPEVNYYGSDQFTFRVYDGDLYSDVATVSMTIASENDDPVAVAQTVDATEDTALSITLTGTDVDQDITQLTYTIVTSPANGALSESSGTLSGPLTGPYSGALTYTPDADYDGPDTFSFQVNDGTANSSVSEVTVTVAPVNDQPVADSSSDTVLTEDTSIDIVLTGSDTDLDTLTFSIDSQPSNGTLTGVPPGPLTYTPDGDYSGTDQFSFRVYDGTLYSDLAIISMTVSPLNDAPTAYGQDLTIQEDATTDITLIGSDVDEDTLDYLVDVAPVNGTLSGTPPSLVYTPNADFAGSDSFSFHVNDGTVDSSPPVWVNITITEVNDPPTADAKSDTLDEDTSVAITLSGSDPESDPLSYVIVSDPANGVLSGTVPDITYTPNADYYGADSFTYKALDGTGSSDPATVSLTIDSINDAPTAQGTSIYPTVNAAYTFTLSVDDVDLDTLSYIEGDPPANGTIDTTNFPEITYTPVADYTGPDSFSFHVNDGTEDSGDATIDIEVLQCATNDSGPLLDSDTYTDTFNCGTADKTITILSGHVVDWDGTGGPYTGNIVIQSGGTLHITGTGGVIEGDMSLSGGTFDIDQSITVSGKIAHNQDSIVDIAAAQTLSYTHVDGLSIGPRTLKISADGGTISNTAPIKLDNSASILWLDSAGGGTIGKVTVSSDQNGSPGKIDLDADYTITDLSLTGSAYIDIASAKTLTLTNALTVPASKAMKLTGTGSLVTSGLMTNNGQITVAANGALDLNAGLTNNGSVSATSGTYDIRGSITGGTLNLTAATIDLAEDLTIEVSSLVSDSATDISVNGHTLTWDGVGGILEGRLDLSSGSTLSVDSSANGVIGADLELNGGTLDINGNGNLDISGAMTHIASSVIDVTSSAVLTYSNANAVNIGGLTLDLVGPASINITNNGTFTLDQAGSRLQLTGEASSSTATISHVAVGSTDLTNTDAINLVNDFTISSFTTAANTGITLAANKTLTVGDLETPSSGKSLTYTGTSSSGTLKISGTLTVQGGLVTAGGATLDLQNADLLLAVDLDTTSSGGSLLTSSSTTITLSGSSATRTLTTTDPHTFKSIDFGGSNTLTLGGTTTDLMIVDPVAISNSGEGISANGSDLTLSGALTLSAGSLTGSGGIVSLNAGLTMTGGSLSVTTGSLNLYGSISSGVLDVSNTTVTLDGNLNLSTVSGSNLVTTGSSWNLGTSTLNWDGKGDSWAGTMTVNSGAVFQISTAAVNPFAASLVLDGGTLQVDESVTVSGPISHSAASTIQVAAGKTLTYSSASPVNIGSNILDLVEPGSIDITGGGTFTLDDANSLLQLTGEASSSTATVSHVAVDTTDLTNADAINLVNDFTISNFTTAANTDITLAANKTLTMAGAFSVPSATTLALYGTGTLSADAALTVAGNLVVNDNAADTAILDSNSNLTIDGTATFNNGTLDLAESVFILNGDLDLTGSTVNLKGSLTSGTLDVTGSTIVLIGDLDVESAALTTDASTT